MSFTVAVQDRCFIVGLCCFLLINGGISFATSTPSESLATLVTLTQDTCGFVNWCSVKIRQTGPPSDELAYFGSCCMPCSCQQNCTLFNTCCPDFKLQDIVNGSIFGSASELLNALQAHSVDLADLYQSIDQSKDISKENVNVQCTYARLNSYTSLKPISSAYFMVTRCSNGTNDANAILKCEASYPEDIKARIKLSDFVPVQSLNTGIVYRNRYCHQCSSEKQSTVEEWDMLIVSYISPTTLIRQMATSVQEIIDIILSDFDIYFEPSDALRERFPPIPCRKVDVTECVSGIGSNSGGFNFKQKLFNKTEELETACKKFPHPVHANVNDTMTVFHNLACMMCNDVNPKISCKTAAYRLLSVPKSQLFSGTLAIDERDGHNIHAHGNRPQAKDVIAMSLSSQCQPGFIYDDQKLLCRKIFCPCGMVIQNQRCVSVFGQIRTPFQVQVSISNLGNQKILTEEAIRDYVYKVVESSNDFTIIDLALRCVSRGDAYSTYLVEIFFAGNEKGTDYVQAISKTVRWFYGKKSIIIDIRGVKVDMKIIEAVTPFGGIIKYHSRTFDCKTSYLRANGSYYQDSSAMVISDCSVCYRIEVLPDEFIFSSRSRFVKIKRTGVTTLISNMRISTSNGTRAIMCIEDVLGKGNLSFEDSVSNDRNDWSEPSNENAISTADQSRFVAFGAGTLTLILVICCISYARKSNTNSGTQDDAEAVEMSQSPTEQF